MSQTRILEKLRLYIEFEEKSQIQSYRDQLNKLTEKKASQEEIIRLKKANDHLRSLFSMLKNDLEGGKCMGFSISEGVEDLSEKLEVWEKMLSVIIEWNNKPEFLECELMLPNGIKKVKAIFENVLNLVLFYQGSLADSNFSPKKLNQNNIMQYVQILKEEKILSAKHHHKIAGHFTKEQLKVLLDEKKMHKTICLAHSSDHTIRIKYENSRWMIYNSNRKHLPNKTLQIFDDKEQLIDEIYAKLSDSICLENVSFNEDQEVEFTHYKKLLEDSPLQLIDGLGLHLMARETPEVLESILASSTPSKKSALQAALTAAIMRTNEDNEPGLRIISIYAPKILMKLLDLIDKSPQGDALRTALLNSLFIQDKIQHIPTLQTVFTHTPEAIPYLYKMSSDLPAVHLSIARMLMRMVTMKRNGLEIIADHAPEALKELFEIAKKPEEEKLLQPALRSALKQKNQNLNISTIDIISRQAPDLLPVALQFLEMPSPAPKSKVL